MVRLEGSARLIDRVLFIAWIIVLVGLGLSVIMLGVSFPLAGWMLDRSGFEEYSWGSGALTISVSGVEMTPADLRVALGSILAVSVLIGGLSAYFIHLCRRVLAPMKQGRPFDEGTAALIRRIAYVILACAFLLPAADLMLNLANLSQILAAFGSTRATVRYTYYVDLPTLVAGLLVLLLSLVFQYGAQLQRESDETL